jgi:hypothetical protein
MIESAKVREGKAKLGIQKFGREGVKRQEGPFSVSLIYVKELQPHRNSGSQICDLREKLPFSF